ncbi:MAG: hypothetical protein AAF360_07055 [Pseudomonadota bacterium]
MYGADAGDADAAATSSFTDIDFVVIEEEERRRTGAAIPGDAAARQRRALLQLADDPRLDYVFMRAQQGGAVVELHDLKLHGVLSAATWERGDIRGYRACLERCEGDWGRRFADQRECGSCEPDEALDLSVNRSVVDQAKAVIVHSPWAKMQLEMQDCQAPIYVLPRYAPRPEETPAHTADRAAARGLFGVAEDAFLVVAPVFPASSRRAHLVVAGFEILAETAPEARLVMIDSAENHGLAERVANSPFKDRIRVVEDDEAAAADWTLAADIVAVIARPTVEAAEAVARGMGFGRLVMTPELDAFSDLADRLVEKIELDRDPAEQIGDIFVRWRVDGDGLRRREAAVAEYARAKLSLEGRRAEIASILRWHWR